MLACLGWAPACASAASSGADGAILTALRRAAPGMQQAAIVGRVAAEGDLDAVVALASAHPLPEGAQPRWWGTKDRLGLFLQSRGNPDRVYRLAVAAGPNADCSIAIERFTANELVLSCRGEKWATYDNQKFVYDPRAKALVKQFSYPPFRYTAGIGGPGFVMSDGNRNLLVTIAADGSWQLAPGPVSLPSVAEKGFGPGGRFRLAEEKNAFGSPVPVIVEAGGRAPRVYRLPQSDERTWREARPDDAAQGARLNPAEQNEQIGPHQAEDGRLWFGKTFYNSEGLTGVGGLGWFDFAFRRFRVWSPPEIRRWSVSAILVEPVTVWAGLYRRGEYGDSGAGLLAWDRAGEVARRYETRSIILAIARRCDALYMGTTDGLLTLVDGRLRNYFIDRTSDGRYRVVER